VRWSPASDAVYYWRLGASLTEGRLVRRRISRASGRGRGGETLVVDRSGLSHAPSFDISRDGTRLVLEATSMQDEYTVLHLTRDAKPDGPPRVPRTLSRWVNFDITPDGKRVVFWEPEGAGDSVTYRVQVSPVESLALRPVGPSFPVTVTWWVGYDSRHVIIHRPEQGRLRWTRLDLESGTMAEWREVPHADGTVMTVAGGTVWISGDGRSLSYFDTLGLETRIAEWEDQRTSGSTVLAVAPDGQSVAIQAAPDSGRLSADANLPVELFRLSLPSLALARVARTSAAPFAWSWGPRWLAGGPAIMAGLEAPVGTRFWVPDGKGGLRIWAEMPPGFDWTSNSADGRVMVSSVTRWTSDILTARLDQPR
jgi:hypothetical protein